MDCVSIAEFILCVDGQYDDRLYDVVGSRAAAGTIFSVVSVRFDWLVEGQALTAAGTCGSRLCIRSCEDCIGHTTTGRFQSRPSPDLDRKA